MQYLLTYKNTAKPAHVYFIANKIASILFVPSILQAVEV